MDKCKCLRCGYVWNKRIEKDPIQCPNCKRLDWSLKLKKVKPQPLKRKIKGTGKESVKANGT